MMAPMRATNPPAPEAVSMLARTLMRHLDALRQAATDADLLRACALAWGTPYGGECNEQGWLDYHGSYRGGETVRAPWCRYSADRVHWTVYRGQDLVALLRRILGSDDAQGELFTTAARQEA